MSVTAIDPPKEIQDYMKAAAKSLSTNRLHRFYEWTHTRYAIVPQICLYIVLAVGIFQLVLKPADHNFNGIAFSVVYAALELFTLRVALLGLTFRWGKGTGVWVGYDLSHFAFEYGTPRALQEKLEMLDNTFSAYRYVLYALEHWSSEKPLRIVFWVMPQQLPTNADSRVGDPLILDSTGSPIAIA